ncbi:MAG: hypothetical protein H7235_09540 [Bdellovibrionaceae bacterium]|nr:hypothetical protein [Pseudobdellovibrionaceae bacterium]
MNGKEDAEAKARRICAPIHANAKRVSDWTLSDPDTAKALFICEPNNLAGSVVDGYGSIQTFSKDGCSNVDETINARAKAIEDAALQCSHPTDSSRVKLISTWQVCREAYPRGPHGAHGWNCFSEATAKFECL